MYRDHETPMSAAFKRAGGNPADPQFKVFVARVMHETGGDIVQSGRRIWDAMRRREDWGLEAGQILAREITKGMIFTTSDSSAPRRQEERGQGFVAKNGRSANAPSSKQTTLASRVKPTQGAEQDRDGRGHVDAAGNSPAFDAPPVREPDAKSVKNDGEEGHPENASNGHARHASSPSPEITGGGHPKGADNGLDIHAPSCEPETERFVPSSESMVPISHNHPMDDAPNPTAEPSVEQRATDRRVVISLTKSSFETTRLGNGNWSTVCGHELPALRRSGRIGDEALKIIGDRTPEKDMKNPLPLLMTDEEFKGCVERARQPEAKVA